MLRTVKASGIALLAVLSLSVQAAAQTNVAGTWTIDVMSPEGPAQATAVLAQNGTEVTGTLTSDATGQIEVSEGVLEGNKLSFVLYLSFDGQSIAVEGTAEFTGDALTGSFYMAEFGSIPFTGKRRQG